MLFCQLEEEKAQKERGKLIECACGHQRYCPQEKRAIHTDGAVRCPVRENHEEDKYGDRRNAGGVTYAEF